MKNRFAFDGRTAATPALPAPTERTTCLITGASSGIGEAMARELAARGHGVALLARREDRLRSLAAELNTTCRVRADAIVCDLSDPAARAELPARLRDLDLEVDVLVSNAGLGSYGPFITRDRACELDQARVMCEALVDLSSLFVPAMAGRRRGALLIVSSAFGLQPAAGYATYSATKAFTLAFGEALHAELGPLGVSVTVVCPGPVDTDFFRTNGARPVRMPRGMWLRADQVARAAITGLARNRRVVVPGMGMRALIAGGRLSPRGLQLRVVQLLLADAQAERR